MPVHGLSLASVGPSRCEACGADPDPGDHLEILLVRDDEQAEVHLHQRVAADLARRLIDELALLGVPEFVIMSYCQEGISQIADATEYVVGRRSDPNTPSEN